ncbi:hypothetical protein AQUCO_01900169v1 [Aquilegia coerulea]|uniref:Uncharacterized protein n=1 Tax=Aquilegia coerulea TaxID=218851 RepID=A0A2G5DJB0_AQUCA|nr:hypothetical protein AQUCO_01900169v1 [Aquilegia coerulea]
MCPSLIPLKREKILVWSWWDVYSPSHSTEDKFTSLASQVLPGTMPLLKIYLLGEKDLSSSLSPNNDPQCLMFHESGKDLY